MSLREGGNKPGFLRLVKSGNETAGDLTPEKKDLFRERVITSNSGASQWLVMDRLGVQTTDPQEVANRAKRTKEQIDAAYGKESSNGNGKGKGKIIPFKGRS